MKYNKIIKYSILFEKQCLIKNAQVPITGIINEEKIKNIKNKKITEEKPVVPPSLGTEPTSKSFNESLESGIEAIQAFCRIIGSVPTPVGNPFSYVAAESEFEKNNYLACVLYILTALPNLGVLAASIKNFPTIVKAANALEKLIQSAPVGKKALFYAKYKSLDTIINIYKYLGAGTGGFKEKVYYLIWGILKEIFKYRPKSIIILAKKSGIISEEKDIKDSEELIKQIANKISEDLEKMTNEQLITLNSLAEKKNI